MSIKSGAPEDHLFIGGTLLIKIRNGENNIRALVSTMPERDGFLEFFGFVDS